MRSALIHQGVVAEQLMKDCQKGFTLGPFPLADIPEVHTSCIGVIPKKHQPGKYRLTVDFSSPVGRSINDGIAKEVCSLSYTKIDDIVDCVLELGRGTLLAKMSAFRIIPVHPADRHYGMGWAAVVDTPAILATLSTKNI